MIKILVATDGSPQSAEARQILHALPRPDGMEIRVLMVKAPFEEEYYRERPVLEPIWRARTEWAEQVLTEAVDEFHALDVTADSLTRTGDAAHEIVKAAAEWGADLVVVGSRGLSGLQEFLLGGVARNVALHATMSVLVGRPVRGKLHNLLLAVDGSGHSERAIDLLCRWPMQPDTTICVVHVRRPYHPAPLEAAAAAGHVPEGERREQAWAEEVVDNACSRLQSAGRRTTPTTAVGDPADQILRIAADRRADLIVAGARGASLLERLVLGSVADRLLRHAECSVLLAR